MYDENINLEELTFPELSLETNDVIMALTIKKDYSTIEDLNQRKKSFIEDLYNFIKEFDEAPESLEFMRFYD